MYAVTKPSANCAKRSRTIFSPRLALASSTNAWTVLPASISEASRASRSAGEVSATCAAIALATAWNFSPLATKSVSHFSSTRTPEELSSAMRETTAPFSAERPSRLATPFWPLMRSASTALSTLPSASSSAFLQSIMPAPVSSRSFLTSAAV